MADTDVLKRSVTKNDAGKAEWRGNVFHFMLPALQSWDVGLPPYWSPARDLHLRYSPFRESQWANAVHIAVTKMASLTADLTGNRIQNWKDLWDLVDHGQSPTAFLEKQIKDFLLTDNGEFIELVHATQGSGSRLLGLMHLDSQRCTRTGDPDVPAIYRDRLGVEHELRDHQVICLSDDPDSADTWYGVGHCAASRAWSKILGLSSVETYAYEKTSGKRPLSIFLINGNVDERMLTDAIATARADRMSQGYTQFMGAVMVPILDPTATPNLVEIPLAALPDGFDPEKERLRADLVYANAIGLDPQEVNPDLIASRALGTASQSRVLDEKEAGKGLTTWRKKFPWLMNEYVYPSRVTFAFSENDIRQQRQEAEVSQLRAQTRQTQVSTGEITKEQALQMAVDANDVPREFLPAAGDLTPIETVSDEERTQEELQPGGLAQTLQTALTGEPAQPDLAQTLQTAMTEGKGGDSLAQTIHQALVSSNGGLADTLQRALTTKEYPKALADLLDAATKAIDAATNDLQAGKTNVPAWRDTVDKVLSDFHTKAYQAGARQQDLNDVQQRLIDLQVQDQKEYLAKFAQEIGDAKEWNPAWNGRAGMYAESIGASYWNGRTKDVALPAQPKDGTTQCLTNCKCKWNLKAVNPDAGDYDAYWQLGAADHCQTCIERAAQWAPIKIRGGVTQLS